MSALGILLLSAAWVAGFPVFAPSPSWAWATLLTVAGAVLVARDSAADSSQQPRRADWIRALRPSAHLPVLALLSFQFLTLTFLRDLAANHHALDWVAPILAGLARLCGMPAAADQGQLFLRTEEDTLTILTNWEKVGLVMPVTLAASLVFLAVIAPGSPRRRAGHLAVQLALLLGYTLIRVHLLQTWLIEMGDPRGLDENQRLTEFTGLWPTLLTHLPLAWILSIANRASGFLPITFPAPASWHDTRRASLLAFTGLAALFLGLRWPEHRSGPLRPGQILWSDHHSGNWEPSRPLLRPDSFGSDHLYNASSLVEWLRHHLPVRVHADGAITPELLRGVSVFVLKTPTRRLAPDEIQALVSWVEQGGGLLLVGDHTNLLGMGSYLNEVASHFDIEFQLDGSNAYSSGYFSRFSPAPLGAHPIVDGLGEIRFLTSCTLRCGPRAHPFMVAHDVLSDPMDYSKPSFFGRLTITPRNGFGLFPLGAVSQHGKGAVIAFAESTTLSNFAAFQDETRNLYLRMLCHLAAPERGSRTIALLLLVGGTGLAAAGLHSLFRRSTAVAVIGLGLLATPAWVAAQGLYKSIGNSTRTQPRPAHPLAEVGFLIGRAYAWDVPPAIGPMFVPPDYSFDALFVLPQRLGAFPRFVPSGSNPGNGLKTLVVVNPDRNPPEADRDVVARHLASGGHIVVLNPWVPEMDTPPPWIVGNAQASALGQGTVPPPVPNLPGIPLARTPGTNQPPQVVAWREWSVGTGRVTVLGPSAAFSRAGIGNVMAEPDERQRALYQLLVEVFRRSIGNLQRPDL